jgi:hypothetical protein
MQSLLVIHSSGLAPNTGMVWPLVNNIRTEHYFTAISTQHQTVVMVTRSVLTHSKMCFVPMSVTAWNPSYNHKACFVMVPDFVMAVLHTKFIKNSFQTATKFLNQQRTWTGEMPHKIYGCLRVEFNHSQKLLYHLSFQ